MGEAADTLGSGGFLGALNDEQRRAVEDRRSRVVVNACAGSGKTATAAAWVGRLLTEGVPGSGILMLTFTRRAAEEMKRRIARVCPLDPSGVTAGTYHAVAIRQFREDPEGFGLSRKFTLCDDDMSETLWRRILKDSGGDPKEARRAASIHSLSVNLTENPETWLSNRLRTPAARIAKLYEQEKLRSGLIDFDDVLTLWLRRLREDAGYAEALRERWSHVMVDEFQDNSELQYAILSAMDPRHLFLVGDPNQCIYSFRGSAPTLMRRFAEENDGAGIHTLSLNYRSSQSILDVANESTAGGDEPSGLVSAKGEGGRVEFNTYRGAADEGRGVCRKIAELVAGGVSPSDIAVLFRSGFQSVHLEAELRRNGIPYRKYGGATISEAADVKDFLAVLRAFHNPLDRASVLRVACLFPGVGEKTALRAAEAEVPTWPAKAREVEDWFSGARGFAWPAQLEFILEAFKPTLLRNYPDDGEERLGRLRAIVESAERSSTLEEFLDYYSLSPEDAKHPSDSIVLSTIHSSKGLEWGNVFLTGAGSLQMPSPKATLGKEISEERRLFYVASTRAMDALFLSYSEISPDGRWQEPSFFTPPNVQWTRC